MSLGITRSQVKSVFARSFAFFECRAGNIANYASTSKGNNAASSTIGAEFNEFRKLYPDHIPTTCFQKAVLTIGSSIGAILNPFRDDLVAVLGETTGSFSAHRIREKMLADPVGCEILKDKPRINSKTVDLEYLKTLPEDSFGRAYIQFFIDNNVSPDTRKPVHFVDDAELAYIIQRYREVHDSVHVLLDMPTNMLGEVVVKWYEAIQTGLPMCVAGALIGPVKFNQRERKKYLTTYLPWVLECGFQSKFFMNVYFEKRWEQSLSSLREELNIKVLPPDS